MMFFGIVASYYFNFNTISGNVYELPGIVWADPSRNNINIFIGHKQIIKEMRTNTPTDKGAHKTTKDNLSYGGRTFIFPPFFHYLMAFFSLIFSTAIATKLIPNILYTCLVLIVYLTAKKIKSIQEIEKAKRILLQLKRDNIETMMMRNIYMPAINVEDEKEKIILIDKIMSAVF